MPSAPPPSVSLCTTVYNTAETIDAFLASLVPTPYEIVVVDGGSTDGTRSRLERYGGRVRAHFSRRPLSRGRGRDLAMESATGEVLVQLDGDVIYRNVERYVTAYLKNFRGRLVDFGSAGRSLRIPHLLVGDRSAFQRAGGYGDRFAYEDLALARRGRALGIWVALPLEPEDATKLNLRGFTEDGHDAREYEPTRGRQVAREIRSLLAKITVVGPRDAVIRPWRRALLRAVRAERTSLTADRRDGPET